MLSVVLAALGVAVAAYFPLRRLLRLAALAPRSDRVLSSLRAAPDRSAADRVRGRLEPGEPLEELIRCVTAAPSPAAGRSAVNEHLSAIDADLSRGSATTTGAIRMALMVGGLAAVLELIRGLETRFADPRAAAFSFALGLVGAVVAREVGRRADGRSREIRAEYDTAVRALERWL